MDINIKAECLSWDWKSSVDVDELNKVLLSVYDGVHCPRVRRVNTDSDSYAMIVSNTGVSDDLAELIYHSYASGEDLQ